VLTGGRSPAERALADAVLARLPSPASAVDLVGRSTARQLAAVLARCRALVAPDTGPVHIATAMGTPVAGLYAVAPPELSGPYLTPHLVVNRFPQAVRQVLGKDPARVPWGTRVHSQEAMRLITVADVIERLELVFVDGAKVGKRSEALREA
jgi:heptosyltransferase I